MRFRNSLMTAAILVAALLAILLWPTRAQVLADDPTMKIFDKFDSRALASHEDIATAAKFANSEIASDYYRIDPDRSILLHNCADFHCDQNYRGFEYLRFQSIFTATALADLALNPAAPAADALYQAWYKTVTAQDHDPKLGDFVLYQPLDIETFQLLAVANRLDMAVWDGSVWNGAELHFVYGLKPPGKPVTGLTLILEFVLAPDRMTGFSRDDLSSLGQTWRDLSDASAASYPAALRVALKRSGIPFASGDVSWVKYVRLRVNRNLDGSNWLLSQTVLDPMMASTFLPARLNDQIRDSISPSALFPLWTVAEAAAHDRPAQFVIPGDLLDRPVRTYHVEDDGMPMPLGFCRASDTVRQVLALNQCRWCHATETGTTFTHIANRPANGSSQLSSFLVGPANVMRPKLEDLYNGNETVVKKVSVSYEKFSTKGCTTMVHVDKGSVSKFHDIARRTLFLAALLHPFVLPDRGGTPVAQQFSSRSIE